MKKHLKKTWKNKLASIALITVGYLSMKLSGDGTAFVLLTMLSMPLFFMKENVIVIGRKEDDE